ncbi:MAG: hypothetical protein WCR54_05875 [Clostridia bacterium]
MKVNDFLKSKAFKSVMVLMCIALVAGGLLAILSDVLYVSDQERIERAINTIYGEEISFEELELSDSDKTNEYGSIDNVYLLEDENYLIKATGLHGYKDGTVTVWIVAEYDKAEFLGLKKVVVASYEKQTLMSSFTNDFYKTFYDSKEDVIGGKYFAVTESENNIQNITGGASKSSNAINNAVDSGLYYVRNVIASDGGEI